MGRGRKIPLPEKSAANSGRANQVLMLAKEGLGDKKIAKRMGIERATVSAYLHLARFGDLQHNEITSRSMKRRRELSALKESLSDDEREYLSRHGEMDGYWTGEKA